MSSGKVKKQWGENNRDKCRLYAARYRKKYPSLVKARTRRWRDLNKEKIAAYNKKYREEHKEEIKKQTNESRKKRQKELQERYNLQRNARLQAGRHIMLQGKCEMCGENDAEVRHHQDYTKPLQVELICNKCHYKIHNPEGVLIE